LTVDSGQAAPYVFRLSAFLEFFLSSGDDFPPESEEYTLRSMVSLPPVPLSKPFLGCAAHPFREFKLLVL